MCGSRAASSTTPPDGQSKHCLDCLVEILPGGPPPPGRVLGGGSFDLHFKTNVVKFALRPHRGIMKPPKRHLKNCFWERHPDPPTPVEKWAGPQNSCLFGLYEAHFFCSTPGSSGRRGCACATPSVDPDGGSIWTTRKQLVPLLPKRQVEPRAKKLLILIQYSNSIANQRYRVSPGFWQNLPFLLTPLHRLFYVLYVVLANLQNS